MPHKYTTEEIDYIVANMPGRSYKEIIELVYERFGVQLNSSQIKSFIGNRKLSTGRTGRFEKEHIPANKGKKGLGGWEPTQFKKGNMPHNYVPVGSERVNGDDYVDIKVSDPNKWKGKHILVWEEHNGPMPKGYAVIFGDGNRRNFDINNLILVSRQQLLILNKNKLIQNDADLTRTGVIIADIYSKIGERKSKKQGGKSVE
jgi:hypothetical protein